MKRSPMKPRTTPLSRTAGLKASKPMKAKPDRELVKWSKDVRNRDLHTCQFSKCGFCRNVEGRGTVAHHIAPRGRRPDLKYDRANGITLCERRHYWIHFIDPIAATAMGLLSDESYEFVKKNAA